MRSLFMMGINWLRIMFGFIKGIFRRIGSDLLSYWWVLALIGVYLTVSHFYSFTSCPIFEIIGLPCAGCGMTRAIRFALTGQFSRAYFLNPLAFLIIFFVLYCFFFRYVRGKAIPYFYRGVIGIIILMILLYVVRMYLYFPERTPYVYNYNNRMEDIVPGYRNFVRQLLRF